MDPSQIRLTGLREDLQLQAAPRGLDGAPYWNLYDPVRNRFFRIGWLEFEMLSSWQTGMTVGQLCQRVANNSVLQPEFDDVLGMLQFLEGHQLLHASSAALRGKLHETAVKNQPTLWQWFLHNYLFFRVPLIKPDAFLNRTQHLLAFAFRPSFFVVLALVSFLGVWRVLDQWSAFSAPFLYFFSWQGLALYGVTLALSKLIHEFAHAYTAKYYGLRVPTMGVAFMMLFPLLYTDTSEAWKLNARRPRLAIGAAGVIAELMLAGCAALLWSVLPDGGLKSAAYMLAAVTWISTLAINLNPFMRFDGYYLAMDAVDMPNLHERSFAFGRWHLRRLLLGVQSPIPELELEARSKWLISFAYLIWIYRLILFTGIAAAVYYFFFKIAGVILFAIEIGWFVVRPIYNEMRAWRQMKSQWQAGRVVLSLSILGLLLLLLAIPWRNEISATGFAQAQQHTRIFPSMAAQVKEILVQEGQTVSKDQVLMVLQSPELEAQNQAQLARQAGLTAQLERAIGNPSLIERLPLWQQELAATQSMLQALQEENARLQLRAPHAGVVRDVDAGLFIGAWIAPQRMLARVVDDRQWMAHVYVSETDVARIQVGAAATILLRRADMQSASATVESIDSTASRFLPHPMLASIHGGPLAARAGNRGELIANDGLYRVNLRLTASTALPQQLLAVQAEIEGERKSLLAQAVRSVVGVLVRESGF